jgi:hypothetical protein
VVAGCGGRRAEKPDLIVLHTGRLRGNVVPPSAATAAPLQHYGHIAGYVKNVRAEASRVGAEVLLIDLGDSLQGSFASEVTQSRNVLTFFEELKYDAISLGNLDGDVSPETLRGLKIPVLCPFERGDGQPAMPGTVFSTRFKKGKFGVDLIANFYGDTDPARYPERFPTRFGPDTGVVKPLRNYAPMVAAFGPKRGETLRVFQWMKFEESAKKPEGFLTTLRDLRVDLVAAHAIYSGDQQELWNNDAFLEWHPPVSQNILRNNRGFALARVDLKNRAGTWRVLHSAVVPMVANTAEADAAIVAKIDEFAPSIRDADADVFKLKASLAQSEILEAYVNALSKVPGVDAVMYSPESIRASWKAGLLRVSAVYNSLPWTNPIYRVELTPEQFEAVRKSNLFVWLMKDRTPGGGVRRVATSRFFALLLQQHFGVQEAQCAVAVDQPEYRFFADHMRKYGPQAREPGWIYEPIR